jgi:cytochrome b involved in lipid metabolism
LRTAFSQEDTSVSRGYIDAIMLTPEVKEKLWELIEQGAYFYVCGRTGFAKTVMTAMQRIIIEKLGEEKGREFFYRLVGEDRYMQEVFTTYGGAQFEQETVYPASEVVLHNNPEEGHWFIINGRVYDLSEFAHLHAGGLKIIQSYAGMDATISYKKVQHDVNPEVDSLLGMYQLGAVRRLNFGAQGGVAITSRGLQFVSLAQLYETWVRFLYVVVEMENALINDYSIRDEQVTHDEKRGEVHPSLYRTQLLLQTHERFLRDYLAKVSGRPLEELWALTSGLCSTQQDYRWMKVQIAEIEASAAAQTVHSLGVDALAQLSSASLDQSIKLEKSTSRLSHADREFLKAMKLVLRSGVQIFEKYENQAISHGWSELLEVLLSVPEVLERYYQGLDAQHEW